MAKFRKKPVVIEAVQLTEERAFAYLDHGMPLPDGVRFWSSRVDPGRVISHFHCTIDTLEGEHVVSIGDWVITGVKGERYPCKPDIFALTYEPAEGL